MVRAGLAEIEPYRPGLGVAEVRARHLGLERVVKLGSNELGLPPLDVAVAAAERALGGCSRYPDPWSTELRVALGDRHRVAPEQVVLGNGADELIRLVCQATLEPGRACAFPWPGFPTHRQGALVAGARAVAVAMPPDRLDLDRLAAAVAPDVALVCVANPNNPTGAHAGRAAVEALLDALPAGVTCLLDEAYAGFVDPEVEVDGPALVADGRPGLCVVRTFSKAYGLAGLRIGYAVAPLALADALERVRTMFNVNAAGQAAALASLAAQDAVDERTAAVRLRRAALAAALAGAGLRPLPSEGNFVFCHVPGADGRPDAERAAALADALLERGAIVRRMDGFGAPDGLRITVGSDDENAFMLAALDEVFAAADEPA